MNKKILIIALILLVSAISFLRSFLGLIGAIPWNYGYSDIFNEDRINPIEAKKIPYLERSIEYPVITGFFIYLMWALGKNVLGYSILTWVFLTVFTIVTSLTLYELCGFLKIDRKRLFWFFIFAPSLIVFNVYNWDIIAVMFMVLAIYAFYKNHYVWAGILLSLGFNSKIFPIFLLPLMLIKTSKKNAFKIGTAFVITSILLNIYFVVNSFDVWKNSYLIHSLSEPNIDSIWTLTGLSTSAINILSLALFLSSYLILMSSHKKFSIISSGFIALLLFLSFNKVFSPQYLLWILPFFVLMEKIPKRVYYSLEASNIIVAFSTLYWLFASKEPLFLSLSNTFVVVRSLVLAYLIYAIIKTSSQTENKTVQY